jgi:putative peptide zinc metalloprotease protein
MYRDESPVNRSTGERSTTVQGEGYPEKLAAILASDCGAYWAEHVDELANESEAKNRSSAEEEKSAAPQELIFKLRDGIELLDRCIGLHHIVVLNDKRVGKFYHLGGHEADVLSLMNGELSVAEIAESLQSEGIQWSAEDVQGWALMLTKAGLAVSVDRDGNPVNMAGQQSPGTSVGAGGSPANQGPTQPSSGSALQKAIRPLGHVISQRIPIASADTIAAWMLPIVGRLFTYWAFLIWSIAAGISFGFAWAHSDSLGNELRMMFSPAAFPLLAVIWILLKAVHEIGHAVAAKRKGVRVGKFGITFFLFAPIPYVDVTDAWRLSRVWSRVQIALAGVYLEGWTAIIATGFYVTLPEGLGRHLAAQWMMMAGPATWLVNANPLMRMDGYYALADAINVPNLRMHGRNYWASLLDRVLLGVPLRKCLLIGWRRWAVVVHAAASLVFQAAWMSGLIIAVSKWGGPVGLIITSAAIVLWCAAPIGMWFYAHWVASAEPESQNRRPRLIASAAIGLTIVLIGLNTSSPLRRSVPVMVQYRDEQIVRAAAAGFVTEVNVQSGQWVRKGDLLLVIKDDDLVLRRDQMKDELELAISKQRQMSNRGELGAAEAQGETVRSLRDSLVELDASIAQLNATASRSGVIVSPHPERQLGRHVQPGDVLLKVADPSDKELLVVFPEAEWAGYSRVFSEGNSLPVRLRGGFRVNVKPLPARPRFSDRLPNPSFAGSGGGDIPVIQDPDTEDGFRAAFPVGEAVALLTPIDSKRVLSGQRGRLYLSDTRTIAQRIWLHLGGE